MSRATWCLRFRPLRPKRTADLILGSQIYSDVYLISRQQRNMYSSATLCSTTGWGNSTRKLPGLFSETKRPRPLRAHLNGNGYARLETLVQSKPEDRASLIGQSSALKKYSHPIEELIERAIFDCRFFTLMAVVGSLAGSLLCFLKGCIFVMESFIEYFHASWHGFDTGQVVILLVEAVDVYLMGTVMLILGMGVYELFVSSIVIPGDDPSQRLPQKTSFGSSLFGLFHLRERPSWLEIRSLDELKTKLGHVIVMILLVGMFEKSKTVPINSGFDLLVFSACILLSSGCLFLLSKLHTTK